jgi:hypothetical protein
MPPLSEVCIADYYDVIRSRVDFLAGGAGTLPFTLSQAKAYRFGLLGHARMTNVLLLGYRAQ